MRIIWHYVPRRPNTSQETWKGADPGIWPEGWPLPHVGEQLYINDECSTVHSVTYYPQASPLENEHTPFVHITLNRRF
jgi:hypothetical protein